MEDRKAPQKQTKAEERDARLKAALKANMGRRKAQARARAAGSDGISDTKDAAKDVSDKKG